MNKRKISVYTIPTLNALLSIINATISEDSIGWICSAIGWGMVIFLLIELDQNHSN